jgi:hypothetical protein
MGDKCQVQTHPSDAPEGDAQTILKVDGNPLAPGRAPAMQRAVPFVTAIEELVAERDKRIAALEKRVDELLVGNTHSLKAARAGAWNQAADAMEGRSERVRALGHHEASWALDDLASVFRALAFEAMK